MSDDPLYAFYCRWAPWDRMEDFKAELALLVTYEQARERRRICTSPVTYRAACEETWREIREQTEKGVRA